MATNASWPLTTCQVAFNSGVNTPGAPTWTDLSLRMESLSCSRGRQYEIDQNQAGEGSILLADKDEVLNPTNPASPYAGSILPYRQVLVQAQWPPTPVGAATNLLPGQVGTAIDPSFEAYTNGATVPWILTTGAGVSPTVTTSNPQQGTKSLTYSVTAGGGTMGVGLTVNCVPGQQYTSSLYLRQTAANTTQIFINGGASGSSTTTTASYVRLTVTWTATQPTHQLWVASFGTSLSGTVNVDAIQHEPGGAATTFATSGPVIYGVHRGFVERWPSTWHYQGLYGYASVTTVDGYAALAARRLHAEYRNSVLAKSPAYYWPLTEAQGTATFGEVSGNNGPSLARYDSPYYGAGPAFQSGAQTNIPGDPGGTGLSSNTGTVLTNIPASVAQAGANFTPGVSLGSAAPLTWTASFWLSHTGGLTDPSASTQIGFILADSTVTIGIALHAYYASSVNYLQLVSVSPGNQANSATTVTDSWADGKPHHYVLAWTVTSTSSTVTLYVDGTQVGTNTNSSVAGFTAPFYATVVEVGGGMYPPTVASPGYPSIQGGVYAHVAVWNRILSGSEITDLWTAGKGYTGETSGARISRYLGYAGYGQATAIDTGQSTMGVSDLAEDTNSLDACQAVTLSENGNFWCTGPGTLTFFARTRRYNATTVKWTFGEAENPYEDDIAYEFDPQLIYNDVQVSNSGGVTASAVDVTSQLNYGPRSYQRSINVKLDAEAVDAANWLVGTHKDPRQRIATLTIKPSANPSLWPVALGAEIGDLVTVIRRTTGGYTMSATYFIEQISHNQAPDSWAVSFQMSPAFWAQAGILDDGTLGRLGTDGATLNASVTSAATAATVNSTGGGCLLTTTGVPFSAKLDSEQVTVTAVASAGADAFGRTVSNGWGTADTGGAWTTTGGSASNYAVGSSLGSHTLTSTVTARESVLGSGFTYNEAVWSVQTSAVATGAQLIGSWTCRRADANNMYRFEVTFSQAAVIDLRIRAINGGTGTVIGLAGSVITSYSAGTVVNVRCQALGSTLRMRVWTGSTEPLGQWHLTASDNSLASGAVGFASLAATGNTNSSPVISYSGFTLLNPQTCTITRPTDGTAIAHSAGAPVTGVSPLVLAY